MIVSAIAGLSLAALIVLVYNIFFKKVELDVYVLNVTDEGEVTFYFAGKSKFKSIPQLLDGVSLNGEMHEYIGQNGGRMLITKTPTMVSTESAIIAMNEILKGEEDEK